MQPSTIPSAGVIPNFAADLSADSISSSIQGSASAAAPFSNLFKNALGTMQKLEDQASSTVEGLMDGSGVDVHQAMIATQKADMSFELALAVRNKAVSAYQQVMQMQF
jgi:flagellar hook-basal body complex protein FliE